MLSNNDKADIAEALDLLFRGYRTATVGPEMAVLYVEDVAEHSKRAVDETIIAFRRGLVPGRNNAFPPSVPEFVSEVRRRQEELDMSAFWDATVFVEADSAKWRAICDLRGRSMPRVERKGRVGWYVPRDEVEAVSPQLIENHQAMLDKREPVMLTPLLQRMNDV
jgi:hypothetical protein